MVKNVRQVRKGFYIENKDPEKGYTVDSIKTITSGYITATQDVNLDSITIATENETVSFDAIIANTIVSAHKKAGIAITEASLDSALQATAKVLENYNLDEATPEGRGIIAQIIGLNIYTVINAKLPFSGVVSDFVGDKNTSKFKLYNVEGIVVGEAGELSKDDDLLSANANKKFAFLNRDETQLFVTGTTEYTFNLKAKATDADNYPMERGKNSVSIGGDVFIDDYDVEAKALKATRNNTLANDVTVETVFDYSAGTIKVTFSGDIDADTPIYFDATLNTSELDKIVGAVSVDTVDNNYIAIPIAIDVKSGAFDYREALQSAGINIQATGLKFALDKIDAEKSAEELKKLRAIATPFGDVIDIANAGENNTIADRYKHFVKAVAIAQSDILEKSTVAGGVGVFGGMAVVDIASSLSTNNLKKDDILMQNGQNGLRLIDTIHGVPYYYDPTHDEQYPTTDDGEDTVFIAGISNEELKKPVLVGVGLPILPELPINELSGTKTARLLGSLVISPNRDSRARNQVRKVKVKL